MKKAWTENGRIRDCVDGNPEELMHPDIAKNYDTDVPDDAMAGDLWDGVTLTKPSAQLAADKPQQAASITSVAPIEFKMLFTVEERLKIKAARATDPVVEDIFSLLDDPRLTVVRLNIKETQDSVKYLAKKGLIAVERVGQILSGVPL